MASRNETIIDVTKVETAIQRKERAKKKRLPAIADGAVWEKIAKGRALEQCGIASWRKCGRM